MTKAANLAASANATAGNVTATNIQSNAAGTPTVFQDSAGTQVGTLCRAWVNYKGTATRAINASFNVSSVTFNTTGDYTVNFSNAMTDSNYATLVTQQRASNGTTITFTDISPSTNPTASAVRVENIGSGATTTAADASIYCVAIFR